MLQSMCVKMIIILYYIGYVAFAIKFRSTHVQTTAYTLTDTSRFLKAHKMNGKGKKYWQS